MDMSGIIKTMACAVCQTPQALYFSHKKEAERQWRPLLEYVSCINCLFEKVLNGIVRYHLFLEGVSTGFG